MSDLRTRIAKALREGFMSDSEKLPTIEFGEWLRLGMDNGFIGPPVCVTHDGLPSSADEDQECEIGDPCLHALRLYTDDEHKAAIEANHAPSVWRASNMA